MQDFGIHFLVCNAFLGLFIIAIAGIKRGLRNRISEQLQYQFWFIILALVWVPFLPVKQSEATGFFRWFRKAEDAIRAERVFPKTGEAIEKISQRSELWQNDFSVEINGQISSVFGMVLLLIWIVGMIGMAVLLFRAQLRLKQLEKSSLPLEDKRGREIYKECLAQMGIRKNIPVYCTAFLKSPVTAGIIHPKIFLPFSAVSALCEKEIGYIFLHELQHNKRRDNLINLIMHLALVVYWFNPAMWYVVKQMECDREIACDEAVLEGLDKEDYLNYGNALINYAEKMSESVYSCFSGMGGAMKEMQRRISSIAAFRRKTRRRKLRDFLFFIATALMFAGVSPVLFTYAGSEEYDNDRENSKREKTLDLSEAFSGYDGSFVLYDEQEDQWKIYENKRASKRIAPYSTYKIYAALLGMESDIITPEQSVMTWDGKKHPFKMWEKDQTLTSALQLSVNWYFQNIDKKAGIKQVQKFFGKIHYGNENIGTDIESYWNDGSLKISPKEQVEMMRKLYHNELHCEEENVEAVKSAICLKKSGETILSGKTGTGRIKGEKDRGLFVGYIENYGNVYYFAAELEGEEASGSKAAEIALEVLSELQIWNT